VLSILCFGIATVAGDALGRMGAVWLGASLMFAIGLAAAAATVQHRHNIGRD
jgi:hypothetical protein